MKILNYEADPPEFVGIVGRIDGKTPVSKGKNDIYANIVKKYANTIEVMMFEETGGTIAELYVEIKPEDDKWLINIAGAITEATLSSEIGIHTAETLEEITF